MDRDISRLGSDDIASAKERGCPSAVVHCAQMMLSSRENGAGEIPKSFHIVVQQLGLGAAAGEASPHTTISTARSIAIYVYIYIYIEGQKVCNSLGTRLGNM